ncbi:putative response regulatory protein [Desulfuromonas versatilis]|uniref:Response regulatory protein n=1 Tax=Desulfuromonas versatilis TaxID=2802975 RepID=A0ABN6DZ38_9BACT|nr:two-component system response regulator BtsR [Desulfuromonas versatilis]BCR04459.1 putative response regulatory protein [Desulfuromonas versatilis]
MIRTVIVDDELHAREELELLLEEIGGFDIVASCANPIEAIKVVHLEKPELVFLDIQMPLLSGFELLSMIDEDIMPHVVFVTAYDEYALKAFEENALDYLLKPVEQERLGKTVDKIRRLIRQGARPSYETPAINRIPCICANRIKLVDPKEVEHVHSDLSGVHVTCAQGSFFTELTLKILEARTGLLRCHKQYLVNVEQIDEITLLENGAAEIKTRLGNRLPVSRRYLKSLKETLGL